MPYTMKTEGLEEISEILTKLGERAGAAAAKGLYDGAGMMADALKSNAKAIRTAPFRWASSRRGEIRLPSPEEKEIVDQAEAGIAKFSGDGTEINTSVGYQNSGYATLKGKLRPVPVIVNAINSGTSFMRKQPFVRKTATKASPRVIAKMKDTIEKEWENTIGEAKG